MKNNKQRANKKTAASRGLDRKAHFDSGGSLKEWRGSSAVHSSKKRNSRSINKKKSIKDFEDS